MLQLIAALLFFCEASLNQPSMLVRGKLLSRTCPDEELALACDAACYQKYLGCKANCDSSTCERNCLSIYTDCFEGCPCFQDCPNGCDGCPNPICTCNEPQIDNSFYRHCMDEATDDLKSCLMESAANEDAYDACYADFKTASRKCPCNSECNTGCPCEGGFKCQENIMAMCQNRGANANPVNFTYVISADGNYQETLSLSHSDCLRENRHYLSPQSAGPTAYYPFLFGAGSALLNGEVYFFGGWHDTKKIAKIVSCEIIDTGKRLLQLFYSSSGSIVTVPEVHDEVVICRGDQAACETFDGELSKQIASTATKHYYACMALFRNQATIIAGSSTATVETLAVSGWTPEPSHPSGLANTMFSYHSCVSVDDGIITTGGYDGSTYLKTVYFFQNEEWKLVGELSNTFAYGSMIAVEGAFLVFGGYGQSNLVERAEWDGEKVVSTRNVTDHGGNCYNPILFLTEFDTCKGFCSENFCYN